MVKLNPNSIHRVFALKYVWMPTKTKNVVRHECTLSPSLLNVNAQEMTNKVCEEIQLGTKINDKRIDMLRLANGIAIITDKEEDLENIFGVRNRQ